MAVICLYVHRYVIQQQQFSKKFTFFPVCVFMQIIVILLGERERLSPSERERVNNDAVLCLGNSIDN